MTIEIPDAAQDAARDACDAWWADTRGHDVSELPFVALEAALPHLIPVITADLLAQLMEKAGNDPHENILAFWDDNTGQYHGEGGSLSNWIVSALAGTERGDDEVR